MASKVKEKETAEGKKFREAMEQLKKLQLRVGFQRGEEVEEDSTDLVDVAAWNELGTSNGIPSRPFMRDSVDSNADAITAFCKAKVKEFVSGKITAEEMLKAIGVFQVGLVQKQIVDGEFEPNAPSTIRKKGSDKPLIDTGRMRQSVNFVIKEKGGSEDE